jgi:hypothetical protein
VSPRKQSSAPKSVQRRAGNDSPHQYEVVGGGKISTVFTSKRASDQAIALIITHIANGIVDQESVGGQRIKIIAISHAVCGSNGDALKNLSRPSISTPALHRRFATLATGG